MMLTTSRKNVVGDSSGKTMLQNRREGLAPSIAAASISERGIDWRPARKKRKLYEICFHTAAISTSIIAWLPSRRGFQSTPAWRSATARMPTEGENRNSHSTPTTAGATA
ncbi:hypothetical protein D9M68_594440 [compost metagenome]